MNSQHLPSIAVTVWKVRNIWKVDDLPLSTTFLFPFHIISLVNGFNFTLSTPACRADHREERGGGWGGERVGGGGSEGLNFGTSLKINLPTSTIWFNFLWNPIENSFEEVLEKNSSSLIIDILYRAHSLGPSFIPLSPQPLSPQPLNTVGIRKVMKFY